MTKRCRPREQPVRWPRVTPTGNGAARMGDDRGRGSGGQATQSDAGPQRCQGCTHSSWRPAVRGAGARRYVRAELRRCGRLDEGCILPPLREHRRPAASGTRGVHRPPAAPCAQRYVETWADAEHVTALPDRRRSPRADGDLQGEDHRLPAGAALPLRRELAPQL